MLKTRILFLAICFHMGHGFYKSNSIIPFLDHVFEFSSMKEETLKKNNVSERCRKDLDEYIKGIIEGKAWALSMFDSMEKVPSGLLMGRISIIGQFYECVDVTYEDIKAQHCMIEFAMGDNSTVVKDLMAFNEKIKRRQYAFGICVPTSCNSTDLKNTLKAIKLQESFNFEVNEEMCTTGSYPELRTEDWVVICVILLIISLSLASTSYEVYQKFVKKNEYPSPILSSFSLHSNYHNLFHIDQSENQMCSLHGIRVVSMAWIVIGHLLGRIFIVAPMNDMFDCIDMINHKSAIPFTNAYASVDSFFVLSGLLTSFVFFRNLSRNGSYDFPVVFLQRYLRLLPPFLILTMIHTTFFSRLGTGPFWKASSNTLERSCRENWWSLVLLIQNYLKRIPCLSHVWFLCVDMQLHLISPVILYYLLRKPKSAVTFLVTLISASALCSFINSYENNLPPNPGFGFALPDNKDRYEYSQTHNRASSWIIGLAAGCTICEMKRKQVKLNLSKTWLIIGILTSAFFCLASLFGIAAFIPTSNIRPSWEAPAYRTFHRIGWSLGLSMIIIGCLNGYGGPVNSLLSLKIFQPLSKLSYSIYLVHLSVITFRAYDVKSSQHCTFYDLLYHFMGDYILSVILAVPVTLLIEMPFANISRCLFKNVKILPMTSKLYENKNEKSVELPMNTKN